MVRVLLPSQLTSYTDGATVLEAPGKDVGAVLDDLDRRYPGLRFRVVDEQDRIRRHMRVFVRGETAGGVDTPLSDGDELQIVGALSGG